MKPDIQLQVLNLKASGKSNVEISEAIGCTPRTVQRTLQEFRLENAAQHSHEIEKSIEHFHVTESNRVRSLCSSLRTVEQEFASRSFADISTSQLLNIVFKLRHQVQKLEDRNEQLLEKAFKMHEKEFGSDESDDEMAYLESNLPKKASSPSGPTPAQPTSATYAQPAAATVQKSPATTNSAEPKKTILTVLPHPKATSNHDLEMIEGKQLATPKTIVASQAPPTRSIPGPKAPVIIPNKSQWPTTGKKLAIEPEALHKYRTSSQAHANSVVQSAIKSIQPGKASLATHPQPKGEPKPLVSYMELSKPKLDLNQPLVGSLPYNSNFMELALSQEFEKQAA